LSDGVSSSLTLRLDPSQTLYLKQKFSGGLVLDVFQVIGSVGGVFNVISGIFAIVFGRDLLIIITGSSFLWGYRNIMKTKYHPIGGWSLSPVGILGLLKAMRTEFRNKINEKFPNLKKEIHAGGMAEFLTEVAIDVNLIDYTDGELATASESATVA
jgi:hypothetical protein